VTVKGKEIDVPEASSKVMATWFRGPNISIELLKKNLETTEKSNQDFFCMSDPANSGGGGYGSLFIVDKANLTRIWKERIAASEVENHGRAS